jgi:tetratricopeptide (TPR) repeat protein
MVFAATTVALGQGGSPTSERQPDPGKINAEHAIFFSGNVMLYDGSAPADPVRIDRVCDGRSIFAAWTDEKGNFNFKVSFGGHDAVGEDAGLAGNQGSDVARPLNASATEYSNPVTSSLRGCELRAFLVGYRSEPVSIEIKSMMDNGRVGTIVLHPLSRASALTVSATSLAAPSNAKKAYERGLAAMRARKWDAAASEFNKALKIYPRYAVAWFQLGLARQNQNDVTDAIEAWKQALSSDPKYLKPYENLTVWADQRGDWADAEKYSSLWLQLDSEDFPGAYLLNAVANARLSKPDQAERSARAGLRLDKDQRIPRLHYVLGLILLDKNEYAESAACFRKYLELAPNASDAAIVRQQLPRLEEMAAASPGK